MSEFESPAINPDADELATGISPAEQVELEMLRDEIAADKAERLEAGEDAYVAMLRDIAEGNWDQPDLEAIVAAAGKYDFQFEADLRCIMKATEKRHLQAVFGPAKIAAAIERARIARAEAFRRDFGLPDGYRPAV